ncbi:Uncharacterised protein [Mycobacteroides abscessus subsp. abscessus]|nr:Uncharacterised protein [Mycobacteroides abscessus subsp. abscessus]
MPPIDDPLPLAGSIDSRIEIAKMTRSIAPPNNGHRKRNTTFRTPRKSV